MLSRTFIASTRRMKGFTIAFQWVNEEPAMCILRDAIGHKSAWVICLSSAHKYADLQYLVQTSVKMAEFFHMENERYAARNLADIVLENIEDLVKMKPEPVGAVIEREGVQLKPEWNGRTNTITLH